MKTITTVILLVLLLVMLLVLLLVVFSAVGNAAPPILVDQQTGKYLGNQDTSPIVTENCRILMATDN